MRSKITLFYGEDMKKLLLSYFVLFFAGAAMTASIDAAVYDEDAHAIHLHVSYCYAAEVWPGIELATEYCQESYPQTCFVSLLVYGETADIEALDTVCMAHWISYDVAGLEDPAQFVFEASDGSHVAVWVGDQQ